MAEDGNLRQLPLAQVEQVDQPSGPAVAVGDRVYRLELVGAGGHAHQRVRFVVFVHEPPELVEHRADPFLVRRRRVDDPSRSGDHGSASAAYRHARPFVVEHARIAIAVPPGSLPRRCHASMMLSWWRSASSA